MKTIYLKSSTKSGLIAAIAKVVNINTPNGAKTYDGEIEFSNGSIYGHYIGQIPESINPETGHVMSWLEGYHANILVPEDFDASVFTCLVPAPSSPVHKFA